MERKPTHGAGRTHKKRCIAKRCGKCCCGSFGKKLIHIPHPYKDNPVVVQRARKWQKKRGIEIIAEVKRKYS